ncbi:Hypothetical_protein [Hexamita inflata]|uniref:Hypothetical_protein n=1 Tax=Hexamita inflata TaxID=28002 RepID=A0AA86NJB4_9EUKA|nr:Hypothetical protein HINF_LOCUS7733 [Hexamita inflata]
MVEVVFENFVNYLRSGNTDKLNIISFQQNQQHKINLSTQLIFYRILTKTVVQLNSNQYSLHDYNTLFNQNQQKESEFYVKQFGGYSQHSEIVYQVLLHIQSACKRCKEVTNVCQDCHKGIKIEQIKIGKGGSQCKICKCYFCAKCSLVSNMCKECRK